MSTNVEIFLKELQEKIGIQKVNDFKNNYTRNNEWKDALEDTYLYEIWKEAFEEKGKKQQRTEENKENECIHAKQNSSTIGSSTEDINRKENEKQVSQTRENLLQTSPKPGTSKEFDSSVNHISVGVKKPECLSVNYWYVKNWNFLRIILSITMVTNKLNFFNIINKYI